MTPWILVAFVLSMFFARDCLLLRMGSAASTVARLRVYAAMILATVILLSVVTTSLTTDALLGDFWSLPVSLSCLLFYGALLVISVWVKRTERHHVAWRIAVLPNPLLAGGMALLARLILPKGSPVTLVLCAAMVSFLWTGLLGLRVWRLRWTPLDVPELDFSLEIAGLVSVAALLVPVLGLVVTKGAGWSDTAARAWQQH
jgi:hypothetical protein